MELIALKNLLAGSSTRLGLTGQTQHNCLRKAVKRVEVLTEARVPQLLSEDAQVTIFLVSPSVRLAASFASGARNNDCAALFREANAACLALSGINQPPPFLPEFAAAIATPVICSSFDQYLLASRLTGLLDEKLHQRLLMHGALVKIHGLGVLITGESGCGKTTGALELAARGHRWIADDAVAIEKRADNQLYGRSHARIKGLLEIKGQGVMPAGEFLPAAAIGEETPLNLIVELKKGVPDRPATGRLLYRKMLGIELPALRLNAGKVGNWYGELELEVRRRLT